MLSKRQFERRRRIVGLPGDDDLFASVDEFRGAASRLKVGQGREYRWSTRCTGAFRKLKRRRFTLCESGTRHKCEKGYTTGGEGEQMAPAEAVLEIREVAHFSVGKVTEKL